MQITPNQKTSFSSTVKIISTQKEIWVPMQHCVGAPYTWKKTIRAPRSYTDNVKTCTAGGPIVQRQTVIGYDVLKFHLAIPEECNFDNTDLNKIEEKIKKLAGEKPLQRGLIAGGKIGKPSSFRLFDGIENLFCKWGIPYTKLKGQPDDCRLSLLYDGDNDEWIVNLNSYNEATEDWENGPSQNIINCIINSPQEQLITKLKSFFQEVKISTKDSVTTSNSQNPWVG